MEEMDDNAETSSSCEMQRVCEEQVEDRISGLPDSILVHILSFLPIEDAVRTVLVPRFRHLWQFLTSLTFDHSKYSGDSTGDGPFYHEKFLDFVRHVLILNQNDAVDKFVLKLGVNFYYCKEVTLAHIPRYEVFANREKRMASEVDTWVYFAMRKKVKVLHLDLSRQQPFLDPTVAYRLPGVVFLGKYLAELKLVDCQIKPSGQIQLNCLKRLFLEKVALNDEIFNQILGGCSLLEELSLISCYGLCRLGFRNSSIKSLTLFHAPDFERRLRGLRSLRLKISCPNIESLDIAGDSEFVDLVDVSSVVVSSISFSFFKYAPEIYETVIALFKKLSHCKAVRTCHSSILVFSVWQLRKQPGLLFHWKRLEFEVEITKWHLVGISCLLRTSPYLETLAMSIHSKDDRKFMTFDDCEWMKPYDFDGANFWRSQEGTFHCLKYHLKTIKMCCNITAPYVIDIIEFLLKNAMVLEKFEISTQKSFRHSHRIITKKLRLFNRTFISWVAITVEQRLEFSQKVLSLPRASPRAVIILS